MVEKARASRDFFSSWSLLNVALPVALLLAVIAVLAGLVFGGVLQGEEKRTGPLDIPTTPSTIIIEP